MLICIFVYLYVSYSWPNGWTKWANILYYGAHGCSVLLSNFFPADFLNIDPCKNCTKIGSAVLAFIGYKQTKCEHSRRNSYRLRFLSRYHYSKSKKYFKKTISNSSLNFHVYWDTLYIALSQNFTQKIVTLTYLD